MKGSERVVLSSDFLCPHRHSPPESQRRASLADSGSAGKVATGPRIRWRLNRHGRRCTQSASRPSWLPCSSWSTRATASFRSDLARYTTWSRPGRRCCSLHHLHLSSDSRNCQCCLAWFPAPAWSIDHRLLVYFSWPCLRWFPIRRSFGSRKSDARPVFLELQVCHSSKGQKWWHDSGWWPEAYRFVLGSQLHWSASPGKHARHIKASRPS